jgi:GTPase SAR1 family protein
MSINVLVLGTKGSGKTTLCKYKSEISYVEKDYTIYRHYYSGNYIDFYDIQERIPRIRFDSILLLWNTKDGTLPLSSLPEKLKTLPILFTGTKSDLLESSNYLSVSARTGKSMNKLLDEILNLSAMMEE